MQLLQFIKLPRFVFAKTRSLSYSCIVAGYEFNGSGLWSVLSEKQRKKSQSAEALDAQFKEKRGGKSL